jgi:alpha-2-macroglobulin
LEHPSDGLMNRTFAASGWIVRLVVGLALAAPVICQDEAQPYFTLSSQRTFGSREQASVMLSGWHVDAVQIRVYRIKDPVQFLERLQDMHSFGMQSPRRKGKRTLIERIHDWKRELRREIRLNLRGQFTESPRAQIAHVLAKPHLRETPASRATYFAQAPVLNQEQLVLSFIQPMKRDNWSQEQVEIAPRSKGVFLVEAVHGDLRAYTILMVSDIVLVTKTGGSHTLAFLADRDSGEPIANAEIGVMLRNERPASIKTDADGFATLPVREVAGRANLGQGARVVAMRGEDAVFAEVGSGLGASQPWMGYIYTDRPVYRPGDIVHFRGILRTQAAVGYQVPSGKTVNVQISDADGKPVYQKPLTTNATGIIHDQFALTRGGTLGNYFIQVRAGENEMGGNFEVQEYKKPEYEVRVTPSKPRILEGESASATIDARYYFGEPVNGAKVTYSVYRGRYWFSISPDADEEDSGEAAQGGNPFDDAAGEEIANEQGQLDEDGKLTISVPTSVSDNRIDYRYRVEARVTDRAGREISGTGWVIATYGSFALDVEPQSYVFQPGSRGEFKVQARDYDNRPVATRVHVALALWDWRDRRGEEKSATDVSTAADGSATAQLTIPAGGSYRVIVTARTPEGRIVEASSYVWASGGAEDLFWGGASHSVQIVPDKKSYRPGDVAKFLIVTGKANTPVWVTVEGRDIRTQKLVRSQGATASFEYTISADDEPGFYLSAELLRGGELYESQKRVKIPPDDHKLCVSLSTDKSTYLPGQSGIYDIAVTSADGKPVAQADLSLGVVDEAIYAIRRDETPDILNFFYGREYDAVVTDTTLTFFFVGEAGTRRMRLAELRPSSPLAQLKPERLVQPKIRKAFPDTAFWTADVTTDGTGRAKATVNFPDSLTTWRATARGVSPGDRFGGAVLKTIVRKNLLVRLAVPRFFVESDEVVISGIVHNYLPTAKKARVKVALEGLALVSGDATQDVDIPTRSEAKVDWRVKAQAVRQAKVTAQALTDEESDALEMDLPINPPGVAVRQARGGTIANSGAASFAMAFPSDAVPASRSLSIRLSPSISGSLFSALEYLTSFPYGCVEQTMSSFLPDLVVSKAMKELNLKQSMDEAALNEKIQAGLDRLYGFQHEDGGWGWWVTDESHPFMTAYVVAGLSEARADGIVVKPEAISKGVEWIKTDLTKDTQLEPDLRAYMAYALAVAGSASAPLMDEIYRERAKLSSYGVALLGLAWEQVKDGRASELASLLQHSVQQNPEEAWWPAMRDEMLDFEADVTPEASAYAMKLLSHERPKSALLPKASLWLVNHRDEGYWWSSTKQTAMVIYGLIDYVKATNELHPDLTATVSVNGQPVLQHAFTGEAGSDAQELVLDESKLQMGTNEIRVASQGQGRLYYSVSATHYSNAVRLEKQGTVSLNVLRDYFRLVPVTRQGAITYDISPLDGPVSQGDIIAVRLTVTGSNWRYLMAEDPIPAGTEFIERDNLYHINDRPEWWRYWFTRRELHDNRMAIFQTYFGEGQQQYFYLLKVVNPGVFHVNPARVQPMYQPGTEATTEARTLEVK